MSYLLCGHEFFRIFLNMIYAQYTHTYVLFFDFSDCIVAPYEADAQLAYLRKSGIVDMIISEDSDLTLFGCDKILFKLDLNGNGVLVEMNKLNV